MIYGLMGLMLLVVIYGPFVWVRYVMHRYSKDQADISGTGAELAEHLLQRFDMTHITVEETVAHGDHFDPENNVVRLSPANYGGRSLTAVAVSAHEVGHAIQFHRQEAVANLWSRYVPRANQFKRMGSVLFMLAPVLTAIVHVPAAGLIPAGIAIITLLASVGSYLFILPMEWDASFAKALPILSEGEYLTADQLPTARKILHAAALTYIAVALMDIVRLWRWGRFVRPL